MKSNMKSRAKDIAECALFVVLMVATAYLSIPFPLVPLTFQTVTSVLAGLLLGWKKGMISMAVYCFSGLVGLPVFASGGGIAYVTMPSFGYILGFILAAFTAGIITGRSTALWRYIVAALAAFIADYAVGIPYCMAAAYLHNVENLTNLLIVGNLVYMPKDAVLCILAALIARSVVPVIRKRTEKNKQQ